MNVGLKVLLMFLIYFTYILRLVEVNRKDGGKLEHINFQKQNLQNIRQYNNAVSFVSFGTKVELLPPALSYIVCPHAVEQHGSYS